jgi:hypothetical protein
MKTNAIEDFWEKVDKNSSTTGCWEWQGAKDKDGYGNSFHKSKPHRWIFQYINGPITSQQFVCHHCDNPSCVNPDHLWLGTLQDNHRDMMIKGRHGYGRSPGISNPAAKLTEQQVLEIRDLYKAGMSRNKLAKKYNMHWTSIHDIVFRNTWCHI